MPGIDLRLAHLPKRQELLPPPLKLCGQTRDKTHRFRSQNLGIRGTNRSVDLKIYFTSLGTARHIPTILTSRGVPFDSDGVERSGLRLARQQAS